MLTYKYNKKVKDLMRIYPHDSTQQEFFAEMNLEKLLINLQTF